MAANTYQKDQLLNFFKQYMSMETRHKLMQELPQAYNAWVDRKIVEVVNISQEASSE
jgi:uncharacterized protein YeeX (DUF496 family)